MTNYGQYDSIRVRHDLLVDGNTALAGTLAVTGPIVAQGGTITATQSNLISNVSVAAPNQSDGSAALFQCNASGTFGGSTSGIGSWINFGSATVTGAYIVAAQSNGIYGTATMTNSRIIFGLKMEGIVVGTPAYFCPFYLGTSNRAISALFDVASGPAIGYVTSTPTAAANGAVPLFVDAGGTVVWIHTFADGTT